MSNKKKKNVEVKDTIYLDKIISSLRMVGLDDTYLKREIRTLSKKEKVDSKSTKKKNAKNKSQKQDNDVFNFDNEIVIGVTRLQEPKDEKNKKNNKNTKTKKQSKAKKKSKEQDDNNLYINNELYEDKKTSKEDKKTKDKNKKKNKKKTKKNVKAKKQESKKTRIIKWIAKWIILICALILAIIFFIMSPLFDIVEVKVENNSKISTDTIISLSQLEIGQNIFKNSKKQIRENIKQNAYIDSVKIKRNLPNVIVISVEERKATFMLEYLNSYAYINNQGYILEISRRKTASSNNRKIFYF